MASAVEFNIIGHDRASGAFDSASRTAERASGRFSDAADKSASRLDRVAEASDNTASASSQAAGGIGDIAGALEATGLISEGTAQALAVTEASIMGLTGASDLANLATEKLRITNVRGKAATVAQTVATKAGAAAQRVMNIAMKANPIGIIITLIALLVAGLVWFFTKTELGQKIVKKVWGAIKKAIKGVVTWWEETAWPTIKAVWELVTDAFKKAGDKIKKFLKKAWDFMKEVFKWTPLGLVVTNWDKITKWFGKVGDKIKGALRKAWDFMKTVFKWSPIGLVVTNFDKIVRFFRRLPGKISGSLRNLFSPLWDGFRNVVNNLIYGWNRLSFTVGGGSVAGISVPSLTLHTPNIPYLADGGTIRRAGSVVVGDAGPELLTLPQGARVDPLTGGGPTVSAGPQEIRLVVDGSAGGPVGGFLAEILSKHVRVQGGDVQTALMGYR